MRATGKWAASFVAVLAVAGLADAAAARAAVSVGQTFAPTNNLSGDYTTYQTTSPSPVTASYTVPSRGVITSWSVRPGGIAPTSIRLKIGRSAPGGISTVGESVPQAPAPGALSTYPTRIPVQLGDVLGVYSVGDWTGSSSTAGSAASAKAGDQAVGSVGTYYTVGPRHIPISARLEPDADGDGYGDETQDGCLTDATVPGSACPDKSVPETTITAAPKKKVTKKRVTFEFTASEAGAQFRCSLNGAPAASCSSPAKVKSEKGQNVFTVFAVDAAGNADASPATAIWKYKKKKKRR